MADKAEQITRAFGRAYDGERRALLPTGSVLRLIRHRDGAPDQDVALVKSGWRPTPSTQAGTVEALLKVEVVQTVQVTVPPSTTPVPLTEAMVESSDRLVYLPGGPTWVVTNYDRPASAPMQWTLWCREFNPGGLS